MSKEKCCKCCKQIWYVDMLDKKLELCPNCYEYCKPLIDGLKIKDKQLADLEAKLSEKEKEIEKINACVEFYKSYYISFKEKVIDELDKVKEKILPEISSYVKKEFVVKEFDNQIKQLKEMK